MLIGIIGWLAVGLAVGFAASKIVDLRGDDPWLGIGIAVGAAVVGGALYSMITGAAPAGFNLWSLISAAAASILAIVIWHFVRTRSPYVVPTSRRSY